MAAAKHGVGDTVKFAGYQGENDNPVLKDGDVLEIKSVKQDDDGNKYYQAVVTSRENSDGTEIIESVYPDEIEAIAKVEPKKEVVSEKVEDTTEEVSEEKPAKSKEKAESKKEKKPLALKAKATSVTASTKEELESEDAIAEVRSLVRQQHTIKFRMGRLLSYIFQNKLYERLGSDYANNKGFRKYAEADLHDIGGYRTAMYLIEIYEAFSAQGLGEDEFARLGSWAKCIEISRLGSREAMLDMIDLAVSKNLTREQLKLEVSRKLVAEGSENAPKHVYMNMRFQVADGDSEVINRALELAKSEGGLTDDQAGKALFIISSAYVDMVTQNGQVTLQGSIEQLERVFGVKLSIAEDTKKASKEETSEEEKASV